MKRKLYILAPNDRFNYGDLLFPYILTYFFSDKFDDIVYVSTTKSDLTRLGGFKTESFSTLYNTDQQYENHLIVAGGESLCAGWFGILSYVKPWVNFFRKIIFRFHSNKIKKNADSLICHIFKTKTYFPFSVGKNELPQFKSISYNALGASWLSKSDLLADKKIKEILNSVDYFTVRDKVTSLALDKAKIKHSMCPDSAILMSEVFSEEMLLSRLSISNTIANSKYIFFQANSNVWKKQYELIISQLINIAKKTNLKLCLCPIGTALGHSDHLALKKIAKNIPNDFLIYIEQPNLFDIMWLIKHSKMYIGSSLHGSITSMSFNIPFIGYGPLKLKSYIDFWTNNVGGRFVDKTDIESTAIKLINERPDSKLQKEEVKKCFRDLERILKL